MAFVKSGWLLWQSTILKHWKNWFDLWSLDLLWWPNSAECRRQGPHARGLHQHLHGTWMPGYSAARWEARRRYAADCWLRWGNHQSLCRKHRWLFGLEVYIPGLCWLMLAQKSCMMRQLWLPPHLLTQTMLHQPLSRHRAMVHTVVHTHQELKLSILQMLRLMLYPIGTRMQDFMDSSLPTKASFVSGIETMTVTWRWACWLEQPQSWP